MTGCPSPHSALGGETQHRPELRVPRGAQSPGRARLHRRRFRQKSAPQLAGDHRIHGRSGARPLNRSALRLELQGVGRTRDEGFLFLPRWLRLAHRHPPNRAQGPIRNRGTAHPHSAGGLSVARAAAEPHRREERIPDTEWKARHDCPKRRGDSGLGLSRNRRRSLRVCPCLAMIGLRHLNEVFFKAGNHVPPVQLLRGHSCSRSESLS